MLNLFLNFQNVFIGILFFWIVSIPFKNSIYQISTFFMIVIFISYIIKNKDFIHLKRLFYLYKNFFLAFGLIILSMFISNILNEIPKSGWSNLVAYFYRYALICIILIYFYSKDFFSKDTVLYLILFSLVIQGLDGIFQSFIGYDVFKHNVGNLSEGLTGSTFNRNVFGFFMGLGFLLTFLAFIKKFTFDIKSLLLFICIIIFIYTTVFSYSRATWVSIFICLISYFLIEYKKINLKHLIVLFFILGVTFYLFNSFEYLIIRFNNLLSGDSAGRFEIWIKALELIYEKPIFGWGIDSWEISGLKGYAGIHNIYLEILFSLGFFGFLAFSVLLYIVLKKIIRERNYIGMIFLMYFLIIGCFDHSILTGKTYLSSFTLLIYFIFSNNANEILTKKEK